MDNGIIKLLFTSEDHKYFEALCDSLSAIENLSFEFIEKGTIEDALDTLKKGGIDIVILDISSRMKDPLKCIRQITSSFVDLPLIVLTEHADIQTAVSSIRYGAHEYLLKNQLDSHVIFTAIRYTIEKKKTEKFHREQIHFLQSVMDNIPSPLYLKGTDLIFSGCNLAMENVIGLTKDRIIGSSVFDIFDGKVSEIIRQNELKLLSGGNTQSYELTISDKQGEDSHFIFYETSHKRSDGKLAGLIGVGVDVTHLKKTENFLKDIQKELEEKVKEKTNSLEQINNSLNIVITKLKHTETLLLRERNIFLNGPVIIFRCKADEINKIEYVSPNISSFGYKAGDFTSGKISLYEIIHENDKDRLIEEVKKHLHGNRKNFEISFRMLCRCDPKIRKVNAYIVTVRNKNGLISYLDGYIIDVTNWTILS